MLSVEGKRQWYSPWLWGSWEGKGIIWPFHHLLLDMLLWKGLHSSLGGVGGWRRSGQVGGRPGISKRWYASVDKTAMPVTLLNIAARKSCQGSCGINPQWGFKVGNPWLIWEGVYGDGHHHGNGMRSDDLLANGKAKSDSICPWWGNTTMKAGYAESIL